MTRIQKNTVLISSIAIVFSLISMTILLRFSQRPDTVTEDRLNSGIRVAVINGCGREGLASKFVEILRDLGYDVVNGQGGNADSFDFNNSVILDRKGNKDYAEELAKDIGISRILDQYSANPYIIEDLVVVIGRDWDKLKISKGESTGNVKQ